jgi:hypothetical protein
MNFFFLHPDGKNLKDQSVKHLLVSIHIQSHNTSEGSEFLDDALRMKDLIKVRTEERIAAGGPEDLL